MEKNSENFHNLDMERAMKLAQTDAAQQLFAMLRQNSGDQLQSAMSQAAAGNMTQAKDILQQLMASDQAQQLLRKLQGDSHG